MKKTPSQKEAERLDSVCYYCDGYGYLMRCGPNKTGRNSLIKCDRCEGSGKKQ